MLTRNFQKKQQWTNSATANPTNMYLFKVNNRNTRKKWHMFKVNNKWRRSGLFIVNFEHISCIFSVCLLLTLNKQMLAGKACLWYSYYSLLTIEKNISEFIWISRFRGWCKFLPISWRSTFSSWHGFKKWKLSLSFAKYEVSSLFILTL